MSWKQTMYIISTWVVLYCVGSIPVDFTHIFQGYFIGTVIITPIPMKQHWRIQLNKSQNPLMVAVTTTAKQTTRQQDKPQVNLWDIYDGLFSPLNYINFRFSLCFRGTNSLWKHTGSWHLVIFMSICQWTWSIAFYVFITMEHYVWSSPNILWSSV